jgi:hypothetical protein
VRGVIACHTTLLKRFHVVAPAPAPEPESSPPEVTELSNTEDLVQTQEGEQSNTEDLVQTQEGEQSNTEDLVQTQEGEQSSAEQVEEPEEEQESAVTNAISAVAAHGEAAKAMSVAHAVASDEHEGEILLLPTQKTIQEEPSEGCICF